MCVLKYIRTYREPLVIKLLFCVKDKVCSKVTLKHHLRWQQIMILKTKFTFSNTKKKHFQIFAKFFQNNMKKDDTGEPGKVREGIF